MPSIATSEPKAMSPYSLRVGMLVGAAGTRGGTTGPTLITKVSPEGNVRVTVVPDVRPSEANVWPAYVDEFAIGEPDV